MTEWRHALISGGGSGLGHGLAVRLLARGTGVTVLDLSVQDERRAALDAAAQRGNARWQFLVADITDEAGLRVAADEAVAAFGAPDLAINSAGIGLSRAFLDMSGQEFRRVIDINLVGSYQFAAAVIPHMARGARLALLASMAGLVPNYGYSAYGASKFGVVGLASVLRAEFGPRGIHVSCICPPEVSTPLVEAERVGGDPVGLELKKVAGTLDVETACDRILAGLDAGRWMIIPGIAAKATALLARRLPSVFDYVSGILVRRAMRKRGMRVVG